MLRYRLLTAAVGIPLALLVIWAGGWWLAAAVAALAIVGMSEFHRLTRVEHRAIADVGLLGAVAIVALARLVEPFHLVGLGLAGLAMLCQLVVLPMRAREGRTPLVPRQLASVALGWVYVPFLLGFLLQLRSLGPLRPLPARLPAGAAWLFLVIACCWVMDTAAFGVGKAIGRQKLAPRISPGKTVAGGIAALLAAMVWTAAVGMPLGLSAAQALALSALLGVVGQVGDLFESLLKRRAGVKDSGALLPGHGGVLDRFDSLLFNAPLAFYFLHALGP